MITNAGERTGGLDIDDETVVDSKLLVAEVIVHDFPVPSMVVNGELHTVMAPASECLAGAGTAVRDAPDACNVVGEVELGPGSDIGGK
ncbi:MAG: hypothetical protein R3D67_01475 [Hyphomicrobiaceae bacterium]